MKIAFLNEHIYTYATGDPSAVGGNERQQWLLARALSTTGCSVVAVSDKLEAGKRSAMDGLEFVGIGRGRPLLEWYRFLLSERPDWLYWRGADHLLGLVFHAAGLAGVQTIFSAAFDTDVHPRRALTRRHRWWPLYAWGLCRAERIFVQHAGQFDELSASWRSKSYVVRSIAGERPSAIQPHSRREKYIAWVGMLRQPKRPDLLVEIARKVPDLQFVVCGGVTAHRSPPGYGNRIIEMLNGLSNVQFLGQVDPEKAHRIIADAALLLSTSDGEGFPNTFLQAWASGTPVVSLRIDPDSVIQQAGLGTVSGTTEAAIEHLSRFMDSPRDREDVACRARDYIARNHSEAAIVRTFKLALRGVCS